MTNEIATRLLEAIAANRLIVLTGAGLSMAPPSSLPSAARVAEQCSDAYLSDTGTALGPDLRTDLGAMSQYFRAANRLENYFVANLVPWAAMNGEPNDGHSALADFLGCSAVVGVPTTNFDALVEVAASRLGEKDFRAIVDHGDLGQHAPHRPYIKLHGCGVRSRATTVWCPEQLVEPTVARRMAEFMGWLAANLNGRDLVFVGFWSDWAYLTDLLSQHLGAAIPAHVFLVDPGAADVLEKKAPQLWAWAHRPGISFHHSQESGAAFLDELRRRWSRRFVSRMFASSAPTYVGFFGDAAGVVTDVAIDDSSRLYAMRRDLTGTPSNEIIRTREPEPSDHIAAAIHRRLIEKGAVYGNHYFSHNGKKVRVISGKGKPLSLARAQFDKEPPALLSVDTVVCAGALPDPSPPHLVRGSAAATIVRPGGTTVWETHQGIVNALQEPHV